MNAAPDFWNVQAWSDSFDEWRPEMAHYDFSLPLLARFKRISAPQMPTPPLAPPKPKLLDRVRWHLRLKHYSIRTEQVYTDWIRRSAP